MTFPSTKYELPAKWSIEPLGDRIWHVWYRHENERVELTYYDIARGIILLDIDLMCHELPAFNPVGTSGLTLNWCSQGRCEVDLGLLGSAVVDTELVCVSMTTAKAFSYPTGLYRGFEYFIDFDQVDNDTFDLFQRFGVDLPQLGKRLCGSLPAFTTRTTGAFLHAAEGLTDIMAQDDAAAGSLLSATCHLFTLLDTINPSTQRVTSAYLQRSQRDLARRLCAAIESDPVSAGHVDNVALEAGIGEASLRSYFSRMYGMTPGTYAREIVLGRAADLLATGTMQISDIALACGYSNPSKFSAAFKRKFGVNPMEYRRRKRLE